MKKRIAPLGLLAVLLVGLIATTALAHPLGLGRENREQVKTAIENNDYQAWSEIAEKSERGKFLKEIISEEDFEKISQRHGEMKQHKEAAKEAIENNDYAAWKQAVENLPRYSQISEKITEQNFGKIVEIHNAKEAGDYDTARELKKQLAEELEIEKHNHPGWGRH